jgi:hypothetical protein
VDIDLLLMNYLSRLCFLLIILPCVRVPAVGQGNRSVEILWVQYGLANNTLKLAAHTNADPLNPITASATLLLNEGNNWRSVSEVKVDPLTTVAEFRIDGWDSSQNKKYRVVSGTSSIEGTVRADPVDKSIIKLMGISCVNDRKFPYSKTVEQMITQNPDLVFFAGDQLYQTNSGGEVIEPETEAEVIPAMAVYLAKWRKFGLTFRDLLKDRPCIIITDDHDVFAKDLWGNGGRRMTGDRTEGGYLHPKWVNAVERVQMWTLPDPVSPGPWGDGIYAYFTSLDYGGVSFAILEDRKFKSPPTDILKKAVDDPRSNKRNTTLEVIMDPTFDTSTLDSPGLNLLGKAQEAFVAEWAQRVNRSKKLAAVLHQSPLVNVGNYQRTFGDMDSNGWPPTARNNALRALSPSHAVMISGDLHYGTILQQGVEEWGDNLWSYSLPPFGSGQGRIWDPVEPPQGGAIPGMPGSGNHFDRFGNKLTVVAKADGKVGYGMILFDKDNHDITLQFHPMNSDTREPLHIDVQGWPRRIVVGE